MTTGPHDGLTVNHAALEGTADEMRAAMGRIDATMSDLERRLDALRHEWAGAQQTAYRDAKARWNRAIAEMAALLGDVSGAVRVSNTHYAEADRRGAARFPA